METSLKVKNLQDDTWQVIEITEDIEPYHKYYNREIMLYQGSLADCEAFIRLKKWVISLIEKRGNM